MAHTRLSIECTLAAGETSVGYAHLRLFPAGAGAICWSSLWNKKQTKIKSKQDHYAGMERKRRLRGAVGVAARTPQRLTLSGATALTSTVSEHEYLLKKKAQMAICCLLAFHSFTHGLDSLQKRRGGAKGTPPPTPLVRGVDHKTEKIPAAALQQGPKEGWQVGLTGGG